MERTIDILCVGEVLIDFIGHQSGVQINETKDYHRYLGGSPTNVAMNCKRLGLNSKLVASVGNDGFADYIFKRFDEVGIDVSDVQKLEDYATSVIFVSRTDGTPDFIPYRMADCQISEDQIPSEVLKKTKIFHTTCFALSQRPAQEVILKKAKEAFELGCLISADLNYAQKIWPDREEAFRVIKAYCALKPYLKISEDDMFRLFGKHLPHDEIFEFLHSHGAEIICLTLGSDGVVLSQKGKDPFSLPAIKLERIVDATGAGDAFWSGFLFAHIKGKSLRECLHIALKLAALKLQNIGRLPNNINVISEFI